MHNCILHELCVVLLDNDCGRVRTLPGQAEDFGFAAGVLLELARRNRIDPESDPLQVIDDRPIGNEVADTVLDRICAAEQPHSAEWWVRHIGVEFGSRIADASLSDLVEYGIVERVPGDLFFLAPSVELTGRYPCPALEHGPEEARTRVMRTLLLGESPGTRDVTLIQLAEACGVFECILGPPQREQARRTISQLGTSHRLCQAVERLVAADSALRAPDPVSCKPIPDVPGLPLLGNALQMTGEIQPYLADQYRRFGPIFRIRLPGRRIVVMGGKKANEFARQHSERCFRTDEAFAPMSRAIGSRRALLASNGHDHIKLRRSVHAMLVSANVREHVPEMVAIARNVLSSWHATTSVSVYSAMQELFIQQTGMLLFGNSFAEHVDHLKYWNDAVIIAMRRDRPKFLVERRLRRVRPKVQQLFRGIISEHNSQLRTGCPRNVVDEALELHRRHPELITEWDLMWAVVAPIMQSLDQMACAMGISMLHVLGNPRYAQQCRAEADEAFTSGALEAEGLERLAVTRALITEVIRLHGTTPILLRTARESFEFEGHWVPAGSEVWLATAAVHYDPDYYRDADTFAPERHLPPRSESHVEGAFTAFGVGSHSCLGRDLSMDLMTLSMATLLHGAELDRFPASDRSVKVTQYPHLRPSSKCRMQVKRLRRVGDVSPRDGEAPLSRTAR